MNTAAACVLFTAFYWAGLTNGFYQDDWGWLNLVNDVESPRDLLAALFAPKAHGNLRPLGENAFWLILTAIFGANPLPFRIAAFLVQFGNLWLVDRVVRKLGGSWRAALATQILWIVTPAVAASASWTSIFNQFLSVFFLLLALWVLIDKRPRLEWAAFLAGFGALEVNVVYPVLAFAFTRQIPWPKVAISAAYVALHFAVAPAPGSGPYALHWLAVPSTLAEYWRLALGPLWWLLTAMLVFVTVQHKKPAVAWFVITLAPMLPLRDHVTDYYLTAPMLGLAMAIGLAFDRAPWIPAAASIAWIATLAPAAWRTAEWHHARGERSMAFVDSVAAIHERDRTKTILISGVDRELFDSAVADLPFRALQIPRVYLTPGQPYPMPYQLPEPLAKRELAAGRAVVYDASAAQLRNVTQAFTARAASWPDGAPSMVNPGDPLFDEFTGGPGWQPPHRGYRTLAGGGHVRVTGGGASITVAFFCESPGDELRISIDGIAQPPMHPDRCDQLTVRRFPAPPSTEHIVALDGRARFGFIEVTR